MRIAPTDATSALRVAARPRPASRRWIALIVCVVAVGLGGCVRSRPAPQSTRYTGPTLRLDEVIAGINQNNQAIATLRCAGEFELWIVDEQNRERYLNGEATLLYRAPASMRLVGTKDLAGRVFDLGVDNRRFWLAAYGEVDTAWVGVSRGPTDSPTNLPLPPALVLDVLGVGMLSSDLLAEPFPTMRFNPDHDVYMLTWHASASDRYQTIREVWYDRATLQPRHVFLFDPNGRVVLRGRLSEFKPIAGESGGVASMASRFDLLFPETSSRLVIRLGDLRERLSDAPNRLSFRFAPDRAGVSNVIDLEKEQPPR